MVLGDGDASVTTVEIDLVIEAPPEAVWEVISDPRNLPHWNRHITKVEGVPADGLQQGTRYLTEMRFLAFHTDVEGEVLRWDPPRYSVIRLTGLMDATVTSVVEELSGGRSLLEHIVEYHFRGGPLGELATRSLSRMGGADLALRHGTLAQKHEIEERYRSSGG